MGNSFNKIFCSSFSHTYRIFPLKADAEIFERFFCCLLLAFFPSGQLFSFPPLPITEFSIQLELTLRAKVQRSKGKTLSLFFFVTDLVLSTTCTFCWTPLQVKGFRAEIVCNPLPNPLSNTNASLSPPPLSRPTLFFYPCRTKFNTTHSFDRHNPIKRTDFVKCNNNE